MARYLSDVLVEARHYLQDTVGPSFRNSDSELELYLRDAFAYALNVRPDIFPPPVESCGSLSPAWADLSEAFPLDDRWFPAIAAYVAGAAMLKDDEHTDTGKAKAMFLHADRALGISMGVAASG